MNSRVLCVGIMLVLIQAVCAYGAGYLTRAQMIELYGEEAESSYSFLEHGGMWADVFIVTPLLGYILGTYHLNFTSWFSILIVVGAFVVIATMSVVYLKLRKNRLHGFLFHPLRKISEGIHGLFALGALWIFLLFYFSKTEPRVSPQAFWTVSTILMPFCFIGVAKWDRRWFKQFPSDTFAIWQTIAGPVLLLILTEIRIHWID